MPPDLFLADQLGEQDDDPMESEQQRADVTGALGRGKLLAPLLTDLLPAAVEPP